MSKTQNRWIAILFFVQALLFLGVIIAKRHDQQVLNNQLSQLEAEIKILEEKVDRREKAMKEDQRAKEPVNEKQK